MRHACTCRCTCLVCRHARRFLPQQTVKYDQDVIGGESVPFDHSAEPTAEPYSFPAHPGIPSSIHRRLAEASAEVNADKEVAPQIASGSAASAISLHGATRLDPFASGQNLWQESEERRYEGQRERRRQQHLPKMGGLGLPQRNDKRSQHPFVKANGWGQRRWTARADRLLEKAVRECDFDFVQAAARFSVEKSPRSVGVFEIAPVFPAAAVTFEPGVTSNESDTIGRTETVGVTAEECRKRFARLDRDVEAEEQGDWIEGEGKSVGSRQFQVSEEKQSYLEPGSDCDIQGRRPSEQLNRGHEEKRQTTMIPGLQENAGLSFHELEKKACHVKSR